MEDTRDDFPPVPLPEPFLPLNAAPARLVRVPFKPAIYVLLNSWIGSLEMAEMILQMSVDDT